MAHMDKVRTNKMLDSPGSVLDSYLAMFRMALWEFSLTEREEMVAEVREYISEHSLVGDETSRERVVEAVRELGDPEVLAAKYKARAALVKAAQRGLPWTLFRASIKWAKVAKQGLLAFL